MKTKSLAILGGVLAASAVAVVVKMKSNQSAFSGDAAEVGSMLLKNVAIDKIGAIAINDGKSTVELTNKDGKWLVATRDNFPASVTAVNEITDTALNLKVQGVEKGVGKSHYGRLGLAAAGGDAKPEEVGKTVSLKDSSGAEIGGLTVGKLQEVKANVNFTDFSKPQPTPQWILVNGQDVVYKTVSGFSRLEADPKNWLDKEKFFKVEKLKSIAVAGPTPEETWKITRDKEGGDLKLDAPAAGEEFDPSKASSQGAAFSFPSFDDILPEADKAKAGLDKPTHTVTIETFEGLTYVIKVGNKVEPPKQDPPKDPANPPPTPPESYYISYTITGTLSETPPPYTTPAPPAPTEPVAPAPLAADANDEAKKKHEEETKKFEEAKKNHETAKTNHASAMKSWEEGKKAAEEQFKKDLVTKKETLAAQQAQQNRIWIVQKFVLDAIMKKRTELMKEKPATPPAEGAATPAPGTSTPAISVNPAPVTPVKPGGKIEAVTPPIEVTLPGANDKKDPTPKTEIPAAPEAPKKPETPKKDDKKKPK